MKKIILSNEEEANEELMWQPRTKATAATAGARGANCCAVTGVTLSKSTLDLKVNETHTLKATVKPDSATDNSVRWSSDKESVATVSASGSVRAKKAGTATITVETNDGGFKASCKVTVKEVAVTGVNISKTSLSLEVNGSDTLDATVEPPNATNKKVTWSSDNKAVATVSSGGLVCAKKAGTATITVETEDGGHKKTCTVTVTQPVTGVSISKTSLSLEVNGSDTLQATVEPPNASNTKVAWSSDNEEVATVSSGGLVCAKKAGTAIITVKTEDGGLEETCTVTVTPPGETPEGDKEENIPQKYVRIVGNGVWARSGPTTDDDSNKILLLESDTYLKYLGEASGDDGIPWYQVQLFDGVEGFVCSKYYDTTKREWIILACVEEEASANMVVDAQGNILYYHCARPKNFKEYRMMVNALYIYDYLIVQSSEKEFKGLENKIIFPKWTPNAIYGLLGNLAVESRMNPDNGGDSTTGGYGLTQWTPRDDPDNPDKYIPWARENYVDADATLWNMDWQLDRIRYEVYRDSVDPNGGQWHSTAYGAGMTFTQYIQSNIDAADLGEAFLRGYEKPEVIINGPDTEREKSIATRRRLAENWKEFFESNKQILYVHEVE